MIALVIMYALLFFCVPWYLHVKHLHGDRRSIVLKAICTGIILLTALAGLLFVVPPELRLFAALIAFGLMLGLAGDVAICYRFTAGMVFFGIGHIVYMAAFWQISTHVLWVAILWPVFFLLLLGLYRKSRLDAKDILIPGAIYGFLITGMLSFAVTIPLAVFPGGLVLLAGGTLFVLSDAMLGWNRFKHDGALVGLDKVCLIFYFLGQSLFTFGIYVIG